MKPHAIRPLLPAITKGAPGNITPVTGGPPATASEAWYQMFGTDRPRCMSFATSAAPSAVRDPASAQLLLP